MKIPSRILQGLRISATATAVSAALVGCQEEPTPRAEPEPTYEVESADGDTERDVDRDIDRELAQATAQSLADELRSDPPRQDPNGSPFLNGSQPETTQTIAPETSAQNQPGGVIKQPGQTPENQNVSTPIVQEGGGWHGPQNPEWAAACGRG